MYGIQILGLCSFAVFAVVAILGPSKPNRSNYLYTEKAPDLF